MAWKRKREKERNDHCDWFKDGHRFFDTPSMKCGLFPLPLNVGRLCSCSDQWNKAKMALCQFPSQVLTRLLLFTACLRTVIPGTQLPCCGTFSSPRRGLCENESRLQATTVLLLTMYQLASHPSKPTWKWMLQPLWVAPAWGHRSSAVPSKALIQIAIHEQIKCVVISSH